MIKKSYRWSVITFSALLLFINSFGQTARFEHYSSDHGFTGAGFKTLTQDSLGFLWITTGSGLFQFDGYTFRNYRSAIADSLGLLHTPGTSRDYQLSVDPAGDMWIGFENHVARFDRTKNTLRPFRVFNDRSVPECMWFEERHTMWFGAEDKGLTSVDIASGKLLNYPIPILLSPLISNVNTIHDIKSKGSVLLLGSKNGLWLFDRGNKTFSRPRNTDNSSIIFNGDVKKIFLSPNHMWLWINDQLIKLNADNTILQTLDLNDIQKKFDYEKRFIDARVTSVARDREGKFWIASQGLGLSFYNPEKNELKNFRTNQNDENSLPSDLLNHVMLDRDQNVWVTTVNKGIARMKQYSLNFFNYLKGKSTTGVAIIQGTNTQKILVSTNGSNLWEANYAPGDIPALKFEQFEMQPHVAGFENIVELVVGKKEIWIGTMHAGAAALSFDKNGILDPQPRLLQPNAAHSISDNFVTALWEEGDNHLWVGTYNKGLDIVDPKNYGKENSVINYRHDADNSKSLSHNGVSDFMPEHDGSLLIATFDGVDRVKDFRQSYRGYEFEHLLSNTHCNSIHRTFDDTLFIATKAGVLKIIKNGENYAFAKVPLPGEPNTTFMQEDRLGRLWIMSFEGLFLYDRKTGFILVFKKEDGLPSSRSVMAARSGQTAEGIMVFSNGEGLTVFDPMSLKINQTKPKPVITTLKINNKVVVAGSTSVSLDFVLPESINTLRQLTLDHTHQVLLLEFSAMDFTAPEKNIYQYTLEGFDASWTTTDWKNRTATYTNLKPGHYTFKVKATNRDGVWSSYVRTLAIEVLPPPWKSWWAYTLYILSSLTILWIARRDLIQRERLASKLKLEHLELEKTQELNRLRSTFFANISHEFRTPLTLIQGPAQNMIDKLKKDKHVQAREAIPQLDLILQNSRRLLRLVNQVLDLTKLESGGLKKEISEDDVFAFLKMIIRHFNSLAIQKKISLNHLIPNQSVIVRFDKDKLEKILSNLIFNALKFTPQGGHILVTVSLPVDKTGDSLLVIDVKDSGVGIPPDQIERIFERFYQVKEGDHQNAGAGIGLALSKELAEFLGGSLTVISSTTGGSTFTLTLTVEVIGIKNYASHLSITDLTFIEGTSDVRPTNNGIAIKPLVLVVEDHIELRKFIIQCLDDAYDYLEAEDGKQGLQLAVKELPSIILSDVMMPEMDGVEMCMKLKQDHRTNHIPIILITAKASEESKLHGLEKGADEYIVKPFNKDELVLRIRNQILAQKRIQDKIRLELLSGGTIINAVSADEKFIAHVKEIIEQRMTDEKLGVETLADDIGLSRVQLYRKVSALTGMTVNDFIRNLRLQKGAQLLSQNWGSVSEIAYEVGFSNPSYFSKCFKDQFGVIPSSYQVNKNNLISQHDQSVKQAEGTSPIM